MGELAEALGIGQSTVFAPRPQARRRRIRLGPQERNQHLVTVNPACCTGLPHAADAVMGLLAPRPCCPDDLPGDVTVRATTAGLG